MSGEVDDKTAQSVGQIAGAQIIVSGAVSKIGNLYRLRVRALSVQSAEIEGQFNRNIPDGPTVAALVRSQATGYGDSGGRTAAAPSARSGAAPEQTAQDPVAPEQAAQAPAVPAQAAPPPARAYKVGDTGPARGVVFYPVVRKETVPLPTDKVYKVGDIGPAGGVIFYVNPQAGEWTYLEAAPATTEVTCKWSISQTISAKPITNSRGIGAGKTNTEYIMQQAMQLGGGFGWAAGLCDELEVNGFDDWFLPSRDELNVMWGALYRKGLGGFKATWYWSSTPSNDNGTQIWMINFADGTHSNNVGGLYPDNWPHQYRLRAIRQF